MDFRVGEDKGWCVGLQPLKKRHEHALPTHLQVVIAHPTGQHLTIAAIGRH